MDPFWYHNRQGVLGGAWVRSAVEDVLAEAISKVIAISVNPGIKGLVHDVGEPVGCEGVEVSGSCFGKVCADGVPEAVFGFFNRGDYAGLQGAGSWGMDHAGLAVDQAMASSAAIEARPSLNGICQGAISMAGVKSLVSRAIAAEASPGAGVVCFIGNGVRHWGLVVWVV